MSASPGRPTLTVAVINHCLRGYPADCLASLGAAEAGPDTEFILLQGPEASSAEPVRERFPAVRIVPVAEGSRAAAKNRALSEARGEVIILTTADTLALPEVAARLRDGVLSSDADMLVSAQLLQENGMRRRTAYGFPSILHEIHPFTWMLRRYHRVWRKGRPPLEGGLVAAPALHATCLAGRRRVFERIGPFTEGYRFAHEDIEYCARAKWLRIPRCILLDARTHKLAPQRYGELPPPVRIAMEQSVDRLVRATHGALYTTAFRFARRAKSLCKWTISAVLNRIICRCSVLLDIEERVHAGILLLPWNPPDPDSLPPDIESHVRWEDAV